jgi:protein-S-isoprenylcysteine O-methyltransferase Ste14
MHQYFDVAKEETFRAKWPHEIFLINLVFNHILVFASTFGVFSTFPLMVLIVPITSFAITGYILIKARQVAKSNETWFVKSHWAIADKRNKHFMGLLVVTCTVIGGGLLLSKLMGWSKIATIALIGGFGLLPFMVALLVLIVLGNDSMYQARHGKLPKRFVEQNPETSASTISA